MVAPIISENIRVRYPNVFHIEHDSVIDDFSYFSTQVHVGRCCHIASGCSIAGGQDYQFKLGDFSGISSGVKIWCASNDYVNDLVTITPAEFENNAIEGDVIIESMCGVGANTVIMPNNHIPEGVAIGALSFVPPDFDFKPWCVYGGNPITLLLPRNRDEVLRQAEALRKAADA